MVSTDEVWEVSTNTFSTATVGREGDHTDSPAEGELPVVTCDPGVSEGGSSISTTVRAEKEGTDTVERVKVKVVDVAFVFGV